jgi:hypothetical protein
MPLPHNLSPIDAERPLILAIVVDPDDDQVLGVGRNESHARREAYEHLGRRIVIPKVAALAMLDAREVPHPGRAWNLPGLHLTVEPVRSSGRKAAECLLLRRLLPDLSPQEAERLRRDLYVPDDDGRPERSSRMPRELAEVRLMLSSRVTGSEDPEEDVIDERYEYEEDDPDRPSALVVVWSTYTRADWHTLQDSASTPRRLLEQLHRWVQRRLDELVGGLAEHGLVQGWSAARNYEPQIAAGLFRFLTHGDGEALDLVAVGWEDDRAVRMREHPEWAAAEVLAWVMAQPVRATTVLRDLTGRLERAIADHDPAPRAPGEPILDEDYWKALEAGLAQAEHATYGLELPLDVPGIEQLRSLLTRSFVDARRWVLQSRAVVDAGRSALVLSLLESVEDVARRHQERERVLATFTEAAIKSSTRRQRADLYEWLDHATERGRRNMVPRPVPASWEAAWQATAPADVPAEASADVDVPAEASADVDVPAEASADVDVPAEASADVDASAEEGT